MLFAAAAQANPKLDPKLDVAAWARASIPGSPNGAVYGQFTNETGKDVVIKSVSTDVAGSAMIHETVIREGMVSMKPVPSLVVPAGKSVTCKPGGCHIMLMGIKHPLTPGDTFAATLHFEDGTSMETTVKVGHIGQMKAP